MDYHDTLFRALARKAERHAELTRQLEDPQIVVDHRRVAVISRELSQLKAFREIHGKIAAARTAIAESRELAASGDREMAELAESEIASHEAVLPALWTAAEDLLIDDDALADHDVILEIRAGVGGDEAGLFAGDLLSMYASFCAKKGLKVEVMDEYPGEMGGYKEVVAEISGPGAFRHIRAEGGVHRVQRVPKTETQGRIHTSTATVAVLPKAEEVDVKIDWDKDVREDKMRAGGPGGQKVNKTESAIRLTHLATGISVHMQDEKSQHKNRAKARTILASRLFAHFQSQVDAERTAQRRDMIGNADRSAKIRTYNFPQDRCTDHRIEFTVHNLDKVLGGDLDALHDELRRAERQQKLEELLRRLESEKLG